MKLPVRFWPELAVVDDLFHQCLAQPLRDAAVDLALEADRVHHRADIVDDDVADDLERTGIGVDLDLADMAAVGVGVVVGGKGAGLEQPAFEARRQASRRWNEALATSVIDSRRSVPATAKLSVT